MTVFEYQNYKEFLKSQLQRGSQKTFAEQLNCQSAFVSQVLRGKPHLSLEQGILATDYFRMSRAEGEYFMSCLQYGRAGSERLKKFFKKKMEDLSAENKKIESKIGSFSQVNQEAKAQFYSSWKYTLIHVLLSLPESNKIRLMEKYTGISTTEIQNVVSFLTKIGLAEKKSGAILPSSNRIHLDREDPLIGLYHRNFRAFAATELEDIKPVSLHYSAAIALSVVDAERIRNLLLDAVSQTEKILRPSPEETVRVLCLDFFEPGH